MSTKSNDKYEKRDWLKGDCELEIFNDLYLRVRRQHRGKSQDYKLNLATLSPEFELVTKLSWSCLVLGLLFAIASVAVIIFFYREPAVEILPLALQLFTLSMSITLLFAIQFLAKSSRQAIFFTRFSGYPLIEVIWFRDSAETFESFTKTMKVYIELANSGNKLNDNALRAGEMKMLRRLIGHGVVTERDYQEAKHAILDSY